MASIYKRGNKYWVSYYINNKQIKKSLGTSNERVARSKLRKIEYELALGDLHVASKIPLPVILQAFCKELKTTRTYKSYKNDFSRLRIFFGPICDMLEPGIPGVKRDYKTGSRCVDKYAGKHVNAELLEDISPQVVNRFITARFQKDGWSAKTANLMRQTLYKLFSYAIKHHGFCSRDRRYSNPVAAVDRKREPAHQIRFLKLEEIDVQLQLLAKHPTIHALVATYIYAGLRREEALWLTRDDVDLRKRLIRMQTKTVDGEHWQPKTGKNRVVPISEALHSVLCNHSLRKESIWFFSSPTGKRWDPDNFSQRLREINRAAGLQWSCLDYRHTFGSQLAQKGVSLYKIATLMGNSPDICRRHYAALIPEEMTDTVEFSVQTDALAADHRTAKMLEEILRELKGESPEDSNSRPQLRCSSQYLI